MSALRLMSAAVALGIFILVVWYLKPKNSVERITMQKQFINVAQQAGVSEPHESRIFDRRDFGTLSILSYIPFGAAFGDYNGDGCIDLYVPNPAGTNKLYRNSCRGTFTEVAEETKTAYKGRSKGAAFGDINNDGCLDLYVTNHSEPNLLFKNRCDGTFINISKSSGTQGDGSIATSVAWTDYNNDGFLDIFVTNLNVAEEKQREIIGDYLSGEEKKFDFTVVSKKNFLFKNNGDETFTEVAETAGIAGNEKIVSYANSFSKGSIEDSGISYASLWFDYNSDRCMDVMVTNDVGTSPLFHNNCDGTFTDVSASMGVEKISFSRGIASGDVNGDGSPDLFLSGGGNDTLFVYTQGRFSDQSDRYGIREEPWLLDKIGHTFFQTYFREVGWGPIFFDFDNDGDRDLYVANATNFLNFDTGNIDRLYVNVGGMFEERGNETGIANPLRTEGAAAADYDNDGDVDLYVTNLNGPNNLYQNQQNGSGNWIKVRLMGKKSNRLGIGAGVEVQAGEFSQTQQVMGGGSYLSQSDYVLHFGLGDVQHIDRITIFWPSGIKQELKNQTVNKEIIIEEQGNFL